MKIVLLVPRVVQRFTSQLPEVTNNAYPYFNYDHRVVNERVDRGDVASNYKGPDQFSDADYNGLIHYAKTWINPELQGYNQVVAAEDALNMAIHSFNNGAFDGKINANKFNVLLKNMIAGSETPVTAGRKKKEPPAETPVPETPVPETPAAPPPMTRKQLRERGITRVQDIPTKPAPSTRKNPQLVRLPGTTKVVIQKKSTEISNKEAGMTLKNAQQFTERLDKVADEVQAFSPEFATQIDLVSDVIEGRREATTLKFDPDEARYMAGRFNFQVRQRDADEGRYMDSFNKNNFEQVIEVRRNPVPIKLAYKKVQ